MTGTIVNVIAVTMGSLLGICIKKGLPERMIQSVTYMLGLSTCVIGLNGMLSIMLTVEPATGKISSGGELLLLVSLAVGTVIGEALKIDDHLNALGDRIEKKLGAGNFSKGFVSASLLFCVGAMAIIGSINDGLRGDSSVLFIKSSLDFIASIVLASTLGIGVLCAAVPVLVYQGAITLLAGTLSTVLVGELLNQICMVGYAIVLCIGINFFGTVKIKTANLLPALLVPVMYNVTMMWKTLW